MSERPVSPREALSALVDGEAVPAQVAQACGAWRQDGDARAAWHDYQLIGDVMRSQDMAASGAPSADFLAKFRDRMAQEPVVLAPSAARRAAPTLVPKALQPLRRRAWTGPIAVAASFVAVLAAMLGNQPLPPGAAPWLTQAATGAADGLQTSLVAAAPVSVPEGPSFTRPATPEFASGPHFDRGLVAMPTAMRSTNLSFSNAQAMGQRVVFEQR